MYRTQDLHVKEIVPLLSPRAIKAVSPVSEAINATVAMRSRERDHPHFAAGRPALAGGDRPLFDP